MPRSGLSPHAEPVAATMTVLGSWAWTMMRWMVRVFSSPMCCQLRPPSMLLYTPQPLLAELRGLPSPVPTQSTSGLDWSMATAPTEATSCSSKIGSQVSPPFCDFQRPPEAAPMYISSVSLRLTSMAVTRPLMPAGPILRGCRPCRSSMLSCCASREGQKMRNSKSRLPDSDRNGERRWKVKGIGLISVG